LHKVDSIFFKAIVSFFIVVILFNKANGQTFYSIDENYLQYKKTDAPILENFRAEYPDTSLQHFHEFFPRHFMGNIGLASPDYFLRYGTDEIGFRFYPLPYSNDRFHTTDINYFRSKGPYANLTGVAGSKQLQIFKLFFTHTYKRVNISLRFNRYSSQGFYIRQQSFTNNFYLSSNYATTDSRAGYYFYFLNNGNRHNENGGLSSDTLNDNTLLTGKDILPIKIRNASRDNKQYKVQFNPWFRLNRDTTSKLSHFIQTQNTFDYSIYQYKDQNMGTDAFYLIMYHDTVKTFDSSNVIKLSNALDYVVKSKNEKFSLSTGYKNEINRVWQKSDSMFGNHVLRTELRWKNHKTHDSLNSAKNSFETVLRFHYIVEGVNKGDYKAENVNRLSWGKKTKQISFKVLVEQRSADYLYNNWVSNHFTWFNNSFVATQKTQAELSYNLTKQFGAKVFIQNINNHLYFDHVAQPRQYNGSLQTAGLHFFASKIWLKHIGTYADYNWQKVSNTSYLRVPEHAVTLRLFYSGTHFKNNLVLNTGFQLQSYSSFYGYAYMPALNQFYLQERYKSKPYPFLDFYLNARIRPVNIFIKIENVLQGYAGTGYSFVPGYYQPDRAFRFGLSWMFFD
jgi:hypothetical protein